MRISSKLMVAGIVVLLLIQPIYAQHGGLIETQGEREWRRFFENKGIELIESITELYRNYFISILRMNPDPKNPVISNIIDHLIYIITPLCVLFILLIGLYLLFLSGSPLGRARAKSLLPGLIVGMCLIPVSSHIMSILLDISGGLTSEVLSLGPANPAIIMSMFTRPSEEYFMPHFEELTKWSFDASAPFLFFSFILNIGALLAMIIRYLAVTLFVTIFPLTIFLYSFLPTREIGGAIMEKTLLWIFLQVVEAIALISIFFIGLTISPSYVGTILGIAGSLMLILVPITTVGFFKKFLPK